MVIKILNVIETASRVHPLRLSEPTGFLVGQTEVKYLLGRMSSQSATGLDGIPTNVLKNHGEIGEEYIARMFNSILEGQQEIPPEWGEGRVSMLEKPISSKGNLLTYSPITVSTVLYRLFTKTFGNRIQHRMETEGILGEMQNGFRSGRRGDDNLFILTSAIEISRKQKKGLICAFLDCSQAYDRVNRDRLWEILIAKGMDKKWIGLLKLLYTDITVLLKHGKHVSKKVATNEGLRQGCPLSPILFMLYISDLEHRLLEARCGFEVRIRGDFWNLQEKKFFHIPGLLFADDLVLMAQSRKDLQKML